MDVRFVSTTAEVLSKNPRIASHARSSRQGGSTALKEHMAKARQRHLQ